jgi:hypothetical protein
MSKTNKSTAAAIAAPAFIGADELIAATKSDNKAEQTYINKLDEARVARERVFVQHVDRCIAADVPLTKAGIQSVSDAIASDPAIRKALAAGIFASASFKVWLLGVRMSFAHGVAWYPSIQNDYATPAYDDEGKLVNSGAAKPAKTSAKRGANANKPAATEATPEAATVNVNPASAEEARAFMVQQLNMLHAWANKHAKTLDLQTRDMAAQAGRMANQLKKVAG